MTEQNELTSIKSKDFSSLFQIKKTDFFNAIKEDINAYVNNIFVSSINWN